MRIAIAIHPFGRFGGGERLSILHAIELSKRGYEVTFYTDRSSLDQSWVEKLDHYVDIRQLPYGLKNYRTLNELREFDRIVVHHHIDPIAAFRIVRRFGSKAIWYTGEVLRAVWERGVTGHDYRSMSPTVFDTARSFYGGLARIALWGGAYGITASAVRSLDRLTVYRYRTLIANSQYTADLTSKVYHYGRRIYVVYPCSSIQPSVNPEFGKGEFVFAVGALVPNKNYGGLIRATSLLNTSPTLVIAGNGAEAHRLSSLAQGLGVRLQILPHLTDEDLEREYARCLFVAIPSFSETFGMTAVEGALAGKPSIATAMGGTKEFIIHGETGFIVDPTRTDDLAEAMNSLLEDGSLRERFGRKAWERARTDFTLDRSVDSFVNVLDSDF